MSTGCDSGARTSHELPVSPPPASGRRCKLGGDAREATVTRSFDDLSRAMAAPTSRRGALKMLGMTGAAAAAAVLLKPFRGGAVTCPAGSQVCGQGCCPAGGTCSSPSLNCCCLKGQTPCGPKCCNKGIACVDPYSGICGCPAGKTPCGTGASMTCCDAGVACRPGCPSVSTFSTAQVCVSSTTTTTSTVPCSQVGTSCVNGGDCCSKFCDTANGNVCGCVHPPTACVSNTDCCTGLCTNGTCRPLPVGSPCSAGGDCTSQFCFNNTTCACVHPSNPCVNNTDCCNNNCVGGVCTAAAAGAPCSAGGDCTSGFCNDSFNPPQCG